MISGAMKNFRILLWSYEIFLHIFKGYENFRILLWSYEIFLHIFKGYENFWYIR